MPAFSLRGVLLQTSIQKSDLENRLLELIGNHLGKEGFRLVDLDCRIGRRSLIRIFIDRAETAEKVEMVSIEDCGRVSRLLDPILENSEFVPGSFDLEVSSPGLDRPLVSKRDFERALGEDLRLELIIDEGRCKELHGMLLAVQPEAIVLKTPSGNVTLPMAQIRTAKKALKW